MLTHRVCCPTKKIRWTMLAGGIGGRKTTTMGYRLNGASDVEAGPLCLRTVEWSGDWVFASVSSVEAVLEISQLFIKSRGF